MQTQTVSEKLADFWISECCGTNPALLDQDVKTIYIEFFKFVGFSYQDEFADLECEFTHQKAVTLVNHVTNDCFQKILPIIIKEQQQFPPSLQNFLPFLIQQKMPTHQELENLQPAMQQFKQDFLLQKKEKTGIKANSLEEMFEKESMQECTTILHNISDDFDVDNLLKLFLSNPCFHSFFKILKEEINLYNSNQVETKVLLVFNRLIQNYISPKPSEIWRTYPDFNFSYNMSNLERIKDPSMSLQEIHFMHNRMEKAAKDILPALESVLIGFELAANHIDTLRSHLPWILFGNADHVLAYTKKVGLKTGDSRTCVALSGFLEAIIIKIQPRHSTNLETRKLLENLVQFLSWKVSLFLRLNSLLSLEEIGCFITFEEEELLKEVMTIYDASFQDTLEKVALLKNANQTTGKLKDVPMLGIGFSGSSFEPFPVEKNDCIYLNFTAKFRSTPLQVSGTPILYAISELLVPKKTEKPAYKIHVLDPSENDNEIFTYITHQVVDLICHNPLSLHSSLQNTFQIALLDRMNSYVTRLHQSLSKQTKIQQSSKPKKGQQFEKALAEPNKEIEKLNRDVLNATGLVDKINKKEFVEINEDEKKLLKSLIDEGKARVCVETVITQFSGNPYTLAFAMGLGVGNPILLDGEPYVFGNRTYVQPCLTRCQLLGIAHTLLGDLKHLPTIQQANDRKLDRGGSGFEPLDSTIISEAVSALFGNVNNAMNSLANDSENCTIQ